MKTKIGNLTVKERIEKFCKKYNSTSTYGCQECPLHDNCLGIRDMRDDWVEVEE